MQIWSLIIQSTNVQLRLFWNLQLFVIVSFLHRLYRAVSTKRCIFFLCAGHKRVQQLFVDAAD